MWTNKGLPQRQEKIVAGTDACIEEMQKGKSKKVSIGS